MKYSVASIRTKLNELKELKDPTTKFAPNIDPIKYNDKPENPHIKA